MAGGSKGCSKPPPLHQGVIRHVPDNVIKLAQPGEFCDAQTAEVLKFGPIASGTSQVVAPPRSVQGYSTLAVFNG
jgi:hypothetical protein